MGVLERSFVLCKQGVAGSIPATSTRFSSTCGIGSDFCDVACDVSSARGCVASASSAFQLIWHLSDIRVNVNQDFGIFAR